MSVDFASHPDQLRHTAISARHTTIASRRIILAITGASGMIYAQRLLAHLLEPETSGTSEPSEPSELSELSELSRTSGTSELSGTSGTSGTEVHLIISRQATVVLKAELGLEPEYFQQLPVVYHDCQDFSSPLATGSFHTQGMIILPCSMNSLAAIAQGLSLNLIHRAAAVCLKERRKLILVPRESPLSSIHLKNMLALSHDGAIILPASPAFYNHPKDLEELVEFFVQRILDQIGQASACFEAYARERDVEP